MSQIKSKFEKDMSSLEQKQKDKEQAEKDRVNKEMEQTKESINNLQKLREQEVTNVFEDEKTLTFIKKMVDFKKSWQDNKSLNKRKETAGKMAEATKNWISSYE